MIKITAIRNERSKRLTIVSFRQLSAVQLSQRGRVVKSAVNDGERNQNICSSNQLAPFCCVLEKDA